MKTLKCTDMGNASCNAIFKAESVDEVIKQAGEHAKSVHNVDVTLEITEKMKSLVNDEPAPAAAPSQASTAEQGGAKPVSSQQSGEPEKAASKGTGQAAPSAHAETPPKEEASAQGGSQEQKP